ncbi:carbohydrate kinase family protein [Patescibacteria group bacterium]|nr:carbohydrate kinase family protein [Patescibacteria group bacterium]
MQQPIDFLAIGDTVTDAFIKLREDQSWIETDNPEGAQELVMRFGDKLPYDDVDVVAAVGNSANAAVAAHRLGLTAALVTNVGGDDFGKEQLQTLKDQGVDTQFVHTHEGMKSNYHYVLRRGAERTILVKHTLFPYSLPEIVPAPRAIYLSSLAENSVPYHQEIAEYVKKNPETKLVFQPGTFQISLGSETLKDIYANSYLFFCNKEEAQRILKNTTSDIKELLTGIRTLGPTIVVITDGPHGAYVDDGTHVWHGPMYPDPKAPVDRTGAGDSFSSTFTAALLLGKTIPEALLWGPVNSMSVVQEIGAQRGLLSRVELEEYVAHAPADYQTKEF